MKHFAMCLFASCSSHLLSKMIPFDPYYNINVIYIEGLLLAQLQLNQLRRKQLLTQRLYWLRSDPHLRLYALNIA